MDIKIVFHPSGDWEGLYIDGLLVNEGHDISMVDFIIAFNKQTGYQGTYLHYDTRDLGDEEGFDEKYDFPLKYEDISN